ncbi:MAG: hypothetical protein E6H68_14945 [Betaproteobacteria bacterium]|nr:MAG: hypothetical protein E6H68_14945 [Betaproteobacteria bacterium]
MPRTVGGVVVAAGAFGAAATTVFDVGGGLTGADAALGEVVEAGAASVDAPPKGEELFAVASDVPVVGADVPVVGADGAVAGSDAVGGGGDAGAADGAGGTGPEDGIGGGCGIAGGEKAGAVDAGDAVSVARGVGASDLPHDARKNAAVKEIAACNVHLDQPEFMCVPPK